MFGAHMSIKEFARLFFERAEGSKAKIPKGIEDSFADPQSDAEREVKALIVQFNAEQVTKFEQELFEQRARLVDAERTLQVKVTKSATESKRIAADKIAWTRGKLEDIQRTELKPRDSRIFPRHYQKVSFDVKQGPKGKQAANIQPKQAIQKGGHRDSVLRSLAFLKGKKARRGGDQPVH
jgi:hypothetical protein